MAEIKNLEKYGGLYSISSDGYIISNRTGKPLKKYYTIFGGVVVRLMGIRVSVEELITDAFLPRPSEKHHLRYIDNNIMNNRVNNLEWYTSETSESTKQWLREWRINKLREKGQKQTLKQQKYVIVLKKYPHDFQRVDKVLGINNTARKYGVHRIEIYLSSKKGKIIKNQYRFIVRG